MLGCNVKGFVRTCSPVTAGVGALWVGDANDFNFTAGAADSDGGATGYSAVALRTGATAADGAKLYAINSFTDSINVDVTQSVGADTGAVSWDYAITARQIQMSQAMTNFNIVLDNASLCCQLVWVWQMNDGTIFVAGEMYVGATLQTPFKIIPDGTKMSTGKKRTDLNGQDASFKGSYSRPPFVFTGGITSITALT